MTRLDDFERLPEDEPGSPLMQTRPDFMDKLMRQVEEIDRRRAARRRNAGSLLVVFGVALVSVVISRNYLHRASPLEGNPLGEQATATKPAPISSPRLEASPGGGVVVKSIDSGSALAKAGVHAGDRVTSIQNQQVNDAALAAALLRGVDNCKPTQIELVRDNRQRTITTIPNAPGPCRGRVRSR